MVQKGFMPNTIQKKMIYIFTIINFLLSSLLSISSHAEENGVGHWMPGEIPFFAGMTPAAKGLYFRESNYLYVGAVKQGVEIPLAGQGVFNSKRDIFVDSFIFTYAMQPPAAQTSPALSFTLAVPFMYFKDTVSLTPISPPITETSYNLSDITLTPINLGWNDNNFHWTVGLNIYAPTGAYSASSLVPSGYNYWTVEPVSGFTYYEPTIGSEMTIYTGYEFNTINPATEYRTGEQLHIDWILAEHFKNGFGLGIGGYFYQQITPDSGSGAFLGSFKAKEFSLGPVMRYATTISQCALSIEFKYLPQIEVTNTPKGNSGWANINLHFN